MFPGECECIVILLGFPYILIFSLTNMRNLLFSDICFLPLLYVCLD
uniref:Uncharacterized protein n=1 Tax=Rhizophora mucronata TaxID=61149 RepID=A0A2P2QHT9_RHIMU